MNRAMDLLLQQWGQERAAPTWEAPVRSPLGDAEQWMGGGRATGGAAGLGPLVAYAERSRLFQLVDEALRSMADDQDCGGLGGRGRALYALAKVRYVHAGEMPPVAAQLVELGVSERTYRSQVAELHGLLQARLMVALRGAAVQQAERRTLHQEAGVLVDEHRVEVLRRQRERARVALLSSRSS